MECFVVTDQSAKRTVLNETEMLKQILQNLDLNDLLQCRLSEWPVPADPDSFSLIFLTKCEFLSLSLPQ